MKYPFLIALTWVPYAIAAQPIRVPIHFFEGLAPKDTTSSERFQKEYETAIQVAKTLAAPRLAKCGYAIDDKTIFYSAGDALEALERGQASEKAKVWMLVGPRRSNHYALLAKGASNTPSISTMASSQEIEALAPLHRSIAPTNRQMAKAAAAEAKRIVGKSNKASYASIVSEDCLTCVDFSNRFDESARAAGIKKINEYRIQGDTPALQEIADAITKSKPTIVLLPNYSKVTAQVIAAVHKGHPDAVFVGGDGWGDSRFGFVQNAKDLEGTRGITIRGFPSTEIGLREFSLGKDLLASKNPVVAKPGSAAALAILKILDGTIDLLCKYRPKTEAAFKTAFLKAEASFRSPWGVSVYEMKDGNITFQKLVRSEGR